MFVFITYGILILGHEVVGSYAQSLGRAQGKTPEPQALTSPFLCISALLQGCTR